MVTGSTRANSRVQQGLPDVDFISQMETNGRPQSGTSQWLPGHLGKKNQGGAGIWFFAHQFWGPIWKPSESKNHRVWIFENFRNQRTIDSGSLKMVRIKEPPVLDIWNFSEPVKHWVWVFDPQKKIQVQKEPPIVGISATSNNRRDSRKVGE